MSFRGEEDGRKDLQDKKKHRGKVVCETTKKQRWFWTWNSLHTKNILMMKKRNEDIKQDGLRDGQEKEC